ncbi:MAG: SGNH/GDSL hydrolase family protein [Gammaproteobacteria bacterium]|nr:SGNH/GDSL hydrolase family protein [Gammaproteobacteria bacterium]
MAEFVARIVIGDSILLPEPFLSESEQSRLNWHERQRAGHDPSVYGYDAPDELLGWRLRPDVEVRSTKVGAYDVVVRANEQGLRGSRTFDVPKPDGIARIGVFGDSQSFGEGVNDDETYSAYLEQSLSGAEVLNFGVHGFGTDQMLLRYETEGTDYDLDIVVLGFAWFHLRRNDTDFSFFAKPRFELLPNGELNLVSVPVPHPTALALAPPPETYVVIGNSVLAGLFWQRIANLRERMVYRPGSSAWELTAALLKQFAKSTVSNGSRFIIMSIDESHPQMDALLSTLAQELSIELVDLGPMQRRFNSTGHGYRLENDGHWNAVGHQAVAAELGRAICADPAYSSICRESAWAQEAPGSSL